MKTLIVYASNHSSTLWCAQAVAAKLPGEVEICPADIAPSPTNYDQAVLGSAIYAGTSLPSMQAYYQRYQQELQQAPLHLFICCINPVATIIQRQLIRAYPPALRKHATQAVSFGGAVTLANLNSKEKALMYMLGYKSDHSTIDTAAIDAFAAKLQ